MRFLVINIYLSSVFIQKCLFIYFLFHLHIISRLCRYHQSVNEVKSKNQCKRVPYLLSASCLCNNLVLQSITYLKLQICVTLLKNVQRGCNRFSLRKN